MNLNKRMINSSAFALIVLAGTTTYAKTPDTIRIGLESVYKDSTEILLTSEDGFAIGYFEGNRWEEEGVLDTDQLKIKLAQTSYECYDEIFRDYHEAEEARDALDEEGIIAAIEPGVYQIYTTEVADDTVPHNSRRLEIYDEEGELILISENKDYALGFQGELDKYRFPATQVGRERAYRGVIEVVPGQYKGITAVNVVDFEEYLYGVLNNEMSYSYPTEALKAQAVASRTMAVYQYNRYNSRGYNLVDTVYSQVYRGLTSEHELTTQAVQATEGEMAYYNNKVAETVYFASSGGHTEDSEYVWGNKVDYLRGVADPFESKTDNRYWTREITLAELQACVDQDKVDIGQVKGMEIDSWTNSGRVKALHIIGSKGNYTLSREGVRTFFGPSQKGSLMSTMYQFEPYEDAKSVNETYEKPVLLANNTTKERLTILSADKEVETDLANVIVRGQQEATFIKDQTVYIMSKDETIKVDPQTLQETIDPEEDKEDEEDKNESIKPGSTTTVVYGDATLYGKGYGHGVGMSQTGAKGMALAGHDYEEIITYYYTGVEVK